MAPWCGHCQALKPIYAEAATALKGKIGFAAVDATAEDALREEYGVSSFPTVKLFKDGEFREDFDGDRTVDGFKSYYNTAKNIGDKAPSDVVELTAKDFATKIAEQPVAIVKFYAPWCGHCKALAPTWEKVGSRLKSEGVLVGRVDVTSHTSLQQEYSVSGFPTIKLFKNGKFKGDHKGSRNTDSIIDWMRAVSLAAPTVLKKGDLDELVHRNDGGSYPTFVLVDGTDDQKKTFGSIAEEVMVEGVLGFRTMSRSVLENEAAHAKMPKTPPGGVLFVVNSGEIVVLDTQMNDISIQRFVDENSATFFYDEVTPGGNFNDVMYSDKMSAVVHVADDSGPVEKKFLQDFKEVSKDMRGKFVFGKMSAKKHKNLSEQVGMFEKFLPGLVVFDSKTLKYFSDREMGKTKPDIQSFLQQVLDGKAKPKTPGDEKDDAKKKPVGEGGAAEKLSKKLYDTASSGDSNARLEQHEQMLKDLIKSQAAIKDAIYQIRDEIIDLRRDMETILK